MKNLVLTTASVLALSAFAAQANDTTMDDPGQIMEVQTQDGSEDSSQMMEVQTQDGSKDSSKMMKHSDDSSKMMKQHKPDGSSKMMKHSDGSSKMMKHSDDSSKMMKQHKPDDSSKMMQVQEPSASDSSTKMMRHHKPKKQRQVPRPHYPKEAKIGGVFVTFPPMDLNLCKPQSFCGKPECPYISHEGYFWYPEAHQNLLYGYAPSRVRGMYWYPSHTHPHAVYAEKVHPTYTHPYDMKYPHPTDRTKYSGRHAPMKKKWSSAPEMRPAQER